MALNHLPLFLILLLAILLWTPATPASAADEAEAAGAPICRFAIPPWQRGQRFSEERKKYLPLLDWMSEKSGCKFVPVGTRNYQDVIDKITTGRVMLAELGPVSYVRARKMNPHIAPLATALVPSDKPTKMTDAYHSLLLSLRDNAAITSLQDLKDQPVGFVSPDSSSGFVFPTRLLAREGLDYRSDFGRHYFLGNHPNVTEALVVGSIAGGATSDRNYLDAIKKHGDIFRILWRSPPIPNVLFASHPSLAAPVREKLAASLPNAPAELFEQLVNIKGFVIRPDSFYDAVAELAD